MLLALLALASLGLDSARAPRDQWSASAAIGAIHLYQRTLSPRLAAAGVRCRFTPSCSRYTEESIRRHGIVGGSWRGLRRIARCGPWTPAGTVDPPD